jgi:hypothetical protein
VSSFPAQVSFYSIPRDKPMRLVLTRISRGLLFYSRQGGRLFVCLFVQLCTAGLRLIVRSWLDVSTFATRRLHARAPRGGRWNCGREMSGNFAEMTTSTPLRDLLHAVNLRHGTEGFTSPPKEGVLRIFSP